MIKKQVISLLEKRFLVPKMYLTDEYFDCPLTGAPFYFDGICMVYYFFELEKIFGRLSETMIINKGLLSVNSTVNTIENSWKAIESI